MSRFDRFDEVLRAAGQGSPCLVLDLDRYRQNIDLARSRVQPGTGVRVVAKSLACLPMLDLACDGLEALGMMTFSARMLEKLLRERPSVEHLLGKPLPAVSAAQVLDGCPNAVDRVIWLIDTPARGRQYADLATARGVTLRVALEVDAGLHRGGAKPENIAAEITWLRGIDMFRFEGVMAYEPHLASLPGLVRPAEIRSVRKVLHTAADVVRSGGFSGIVNTAGSKTFADYGPSDGVSEVSLGSVLVKPTDFDSPATTGFEAALFIATPVLKYLPDNPVPGFGWLSRLPRLRRRADLAVYGGYWKARPVHPPGYGYSRVFGHSSNQEVWTGPRLDQSPVDHFAFLQPNHSEAVLPEFGEVIVVARGEIADRWPCLPAAQ